MASADGPEIVLIAAVARDGGIGRGGDLLWRDPVDQRHFRDATMGAPVIMGRRTWDSLPVRFRPLPGRRNLVVSRQAALDAPGAEVVGSLDEALSRCAGSPRVAVIGGAELYALALPRAQVLLLTEVDAVFEGADVFFPAWDRQAYNERVIGTGTSGGLAVDFKIVEYRRRPCGLNP
jgi:dihydrofolate reductase